MKKTAPDKKRASLSGKKTVRAPAMVGAGLQIEPQTGRLQARSAVPNAAHQRKNLSLIHVFPTSQTKLFHGTALAFLDEENTQSTIERMRNGLPAITFAVLSKELDISKERLYEALGVKRSTMEKRMKDQELLAPGEADKAYWASRAFKRAVVVLEDVAAAKSWMTREVRSLGGVTPLSLLDTAAGYEIVMQTLGRIEHGIPS